MKKRSLTILITIAVLVLITFVTYGYIKKRNAFAAATRLYLQGLKPDESKDNAFASEAQLNFYDSIERTASLPEENLTQLRYFKSVALVKVGREKEAVDLLVPLLQKISPTEHLLLAGVQRQLALAYLRLGERNNCVSNHSSGSCIFPIAGKGVYIDPYASQKAIDLYLEIMRQDSTDLESRWMLNVAYMTIGQYPKKVPTAWLIPGLDTDTSSYKVQPFQEMATGLQLNNGRNMAGGSIIDDFNNDGYLDIITSCWGLGESMHYYKNNANGTFTDIAKEAGLSNIKGGLNITQADFNNDGFTDILIIRGAWLAEHGKQPKSLLRNNGDGTFTDVTVESGILSLNPTQAAVWADFNNDGWLDLFIGNETTSQEFPHPSELYINNHDGSFTNVAKEAGCEGVAFMKGVTAGDYNRDGWPDIFISDLGGRKVLLKNKAVHARIPQFENATHEAGLDRDITYTFPTWFWDYDNDGWPDIFVCGYGYTGSLGITAAAEALHQPLAPNTTTMYLYRNNHDGTFTNVTEDVGLNRPVFAMGSNFGDIDNDGWPDMYLGTGNPNFNSLVPNRMFKNIGGRKFADVTSSARVGNLQKGHGVSFGDIDNDGDQDIFIEVGGAFPGDSYFNSFYVNPGQGNNHSINVLLEGVKSNRSAIGAHISVSFRDSGIKRTVYMDVNSGGSFGSNPLRKQIGIGKATMIDELTIQWPTSGIVQVFKNVVPGQYLKIKEGVNELVKMNLKTLKFVMKDDKMNLLDCVPAK